MAEFWDIYDGNKKNTGRTAERGVYEFKDGEYHLVVQAIILNTKNDNQKGFIDLQPLIQASPFLIKL